MAQAQQTHRGLGSFGFSLVGAGESLRRLIGVAAAAVLALAGPALAQGQALEDLRSRYPALKTHDPHGRILTVWGQPMTRGETPREAAEEWVFWYGEVFGSELNLDEFREVKLRRAPEGTERQVFMYRQTIDGLAVIGSSFRVMTEGEPEGGPAAVVYVAGRVVIRPAGGLAEPTVTPAEALAAAMAHPTGRKMLRWSEAELVAIYDDPPRGEATAQPAWRLSGGGEGESYTFYVHAVTGEVVRYHSNSMHAANDVQGTVTGNATPAEAHPDLGPDTFAATTSCPNDADEFELRDTWVTAKAAGTGTVVGAALTDEEGDYTLDITGSGPVDVFAELKGPAWFVLDGSDPQAPGYPWGDPIAPLAHAGNPVATPATGVDLEFNPSPTAKWTALVNAHHVMSKTWRFLDIENTEIPVAPVIAHYYHPTRTCVGSYMSSSEPGNPWSQGAIRLEQGSSTCANPAYSTAIAHEYGHFIAHHLMGIAPDVDSGSFHEGFADALAFLVFDTEIFGQDANGCGAHIREPLVTDPDYPVCPTVWWYGTPAHEGGELLGALWLDIRNDLGVTEARELFLDWMMLAQVPGEQHGCMRPPEIPDHVYMPQSADETTLLDVLSVAAEDQRAAICDIFDEREIKPPPGAPCGDSAGRSCYADCDGNGTVDFWDFLCFQNAFAAGSAAADCDGDGHFTFFDYLCFENEFAGCPS